LRRLHFTAKYIRDARDELFTATNLKERRKTPEYVAVSTSAVEGEFRETSSCAEVVSGGKTRMRRG